MFRKEKPAPKREFAIREVGLVSTYVEFETTSNVLQEIRDMNFGYILKSGNKKWSLYVSDTFDFDEVLNYLKSFRN